MTSCLFYCYNHLRKSWYYLLFIWWDSLASQQMTFYPQCNSLTAPVLLCLIIPKHVKFKGGNFIVMKFVMPVTISELSEAGLCSLARKPGSWVRIPHKAWMSGMCMRLFCLCCSVLGRGLPTSWSLVQGARPSVKWSKWKNKHRHRKGIRGTD
jgi:hypothetical protein